MIPAGFAYHRPSDVSSAVALLQEHGDEARVIAGGHSLIPMMKLRMADLSHLIDLQDISDLQAVEIGAEAVTIGAMVTQHTLITHEELGSALPIIPEAALQIADPQVRYMGTVGGNVANGDPGNDMPGLMQCLGAIYTLHGTDGTREVAAREFYEAAYFTAREDEEILTKITIPRPAAGAGYAYEKQKRKIGDYATAACGAMITMENGTCTDASVAMTNLSDTPVWSEEAAAWLEGTACGKGNVDAAVAACLDAIDPTEDNRGPVDFKRHVAGVIIRRAIERAVSRA